MKDRHPIDLEASFQHQFAGIISSIGSLYCLSRDDVFFVDLEKKCKDIQGKTKYLDITCSFENADISCAIELKFKTKKQGAQDLSKQDIYYDILSLEEATSKGYNFGMFYMITNSRAYLNPSLRGLGTIFDTSNGYEIQSGKRYYEQERSWARPIDLLFKNNYRFEWVTVENWHFLEISINPVGNI